MKELDTKVQKWFLDNEPSDEMRYKDIWWRNNVFIRDRILVLFNSKEAEVIGTHYSKSIKCPIIKTVYKGVEVIWQYNFYDWQIMIKSNKEIKLEFLELCNANGNYFYYQGIPNEYQFEPYSKKNKKHFAINIRGNNHLDVWAFTLELRKAIDR
jgi:hypothetical protein